MTEMTAEQYRGRNVLVVGLARSGIAAAQLLHRIGAKVTVNDSKTREALGEALRPLEQLDVIWRLGCGAGELLQGQDELVISPGIPDTAAFVVQAKEMGIRVIGELELAASLWPGKMVALTGTNGKTTTVSLLAQIFADADPAHRTWAVGNIGFPFSQAVLEGSAEDMAVCECSSFQMETIETFHPSAAALLNITEDHLNRHGTMAEYTRLKMRIFENQGAEDFAVFNADDPALEGLDRQVRSRVLFFSRRREAGDGAFVRDGIVMARMGGAEEAILPAKEIYIPGPHNLENALAAVCIAKAMGVPTDSLAQTLRTFRGVEHRIEFTRELDGVQWFNDSKGTNVDSTIRAVQTMTRPTVIILGGSDKHCDFTPLAKEIIASPMIREAVLIGVTANQIEDTLRRCGWDRIHRAYSMEEAVQRCRKLAERGWNVLLSPACASFDMFHDYEERGRVFKQLVMELTGERA
ncbi:MAG: UDP-N-acetylmuramoyl-L-alanine--D-glutamate ligase [Clostridia bacterium]|nr:UDP-N-acetylmuramoyl-L-alanine--D-glutamate ligase [Clostridia bacterium]